MKRLLSALPLYLSYSRYSSLAQPKLLPHPREALRPALRAILRIELSQNARTMERM
jgi:hypothetical protein